jgi:hypothetical protein
MIGTVNRTLAEKFDIVTRFPNTAATITYVKPDGTTTTRTITAIKPPHTGKDFNRTITAFDMMRGAWRCFRIDRITPDGVKLFQMPVMGGVPKELAL